MVGAERIFVMENWMKELAAETDSRAQRSHMMRSAERPGATGETRTRKLMRRLGELLSTGRGTRHPVSDAAPRSIPTLALLQAVARGDVSPQAAHRLLTR